MQHATCNSKICQRAFLSVVACCVLLVAVVGCESFQRKFTRRSKRAAPPPSPIINFQDYSQAMTPLERYRKHYLMFDYWNGELIDALKSEPPNPKRYKRASNEAIAELQAMQGLVKEELAHRFEPVLAERSRLDRQLQSATFDATRASAAWRVLDTQILAIHRAFFWRDVEDELKPAVAAGN